MTEKSSLTSGDKEDNETRRDERRRKLYRRIWTREINERERERIEDMRRRNGGRGKTGGAPRRTNSMNVVDEAQKKKKRGRMIDRSSAPRL